MPHYLIQHITRYRYDAPVRENVTEARMRPLSDEFQRCLSFTLTVDPPAQVAAYEDFLGNIIHTFDVPASHVDLHITAEAIVDVRQLPDLPNAVSTAEWQQVDRLVVQSELWDFVRPSLRTQPTSLLHDLMGELDVTRERDPLTALRRINEGIYRSFAYAPQSTRVDSPIDEAIAARRGVCQDLTHVMIAMVRQLGIPCRYVSGYLYHRREDQDRSAEDATHAWVEAYVPSLGWLGFDPTNNLNATERHIRVAVGRDYEDVPPTRGVYVGQAEETLDVGVRVTTADVAPVPDETILPETPWEAPPLRPEASQQQQQQQQQ